MVTKITSGLEDPTVAKASNLSYLKNSHAILSPRRTFLDTIEPTFSAHIANFGSENSREDSVSPINARAFSNRSPAKFIPSRSPPQRAMSPLLSERRISRRSGSPPTSATVEYVIFLSILVSISSFISSHIIYFLMKFFAHFLIDIFDPSSEYLNEYGREGKKKSFFSFTKQKK